MKTNRSRHQGRGPLGAPPALASVTFTAALAALTLTAGCTDDIVEPQCDSELALVMRGEVDSRDVKVHSRTIGGRWLQEKFTIQLPDPQRQGGWWVLELGYNPLLDDLGFAHEANLSNDMADAPSSTFRLTSHLPGESSDSSELVCDPRQGELCGGLGLYEPGHFDPETDLPGSRPYDGYLPIRNGELTFFVRTTIALQGTYEVELDWDLQEPTRGTGQVAGCFQAQRVRAQGRGDVLQ